MVKLFVFIPCYRDQISGVTFETSHMLMSTLLSKGMQASIGRYSWFDIAEMRNIALSYWYDCMPDSTHLLFVDDDVGFPPEVVTDMIAFGEPMVGALYRKKCEKFDWAASALPKGTGEFRGRSFLEVEGLGCGCFLIRRDAIDKMVEHFPEEIRHHVVIGDFKIAGLKRTLGFFDSIMTPDGKVSEDISFCRRWRQTGGKVWANTAHVMTHVGQYEFKGSYAQWRMEEESKPLKQTAPDAPVRRSVKAKHGFFEVNPNDTFIGTSLLEYGEWCEFEIDLLRKFVGPGDTIVDVGANIGTHTIPFSEMVSQSGKVIAFEPQPRLAEMLRANVEMNGVESIVDVHVCAAGRIPTIMPLADLPPDDTKFNFGAVPLNAPCQSGSKTGVETIDELGVLPRLIKIDVEGMEADVIRGAIGTIKDAQPVLYLECNGEDTSDIATVLHEIGYKAYWSMGPYFNPKNFFKNGRNLWPGVMPSVNLLAIPENAPPLLMQEYLGFGDNWIKATGRIMADDQAALASRPEFVSGGNDQSAA